MSRPTKDCPEWLRIRAGSPHWFSPGAIRFFNSKIYWGTLTSYKAGWLFISSEGDEYNSLYPIARGWTIRFATVSDVDTFGEFKEFQSLAAAKAAMNQIVKGTSNE
jgi:hypothetical protein